MTFLLWVLAYLVLSTAFSVFLGQFIKAGAGVEQ